MKRLVVFELHHLGDAVMALPFLRAVSGRFATSVVCRPPVAEFLRAAGSGISVLDAPTGWAARAAQARQLALGEEDCAACVWADSRVHILMALTGAGSRVGFPMTPQNYYPVGIPWGRRRLLAGELLAAAAGLAGRPLLTHALVRNARSQHHMLDWNQLAEAMGLAVRMEAPWLDAPGMLPAAVRDFLAGQAGRPVVLVHPGGRLPAKRWPYFSELLHELSVRDREAVLIVQPPGEPALSPCGARQQSVSCPDWKTVFAVMQAADAVVCNDSLPGHLAAALGRPVVTIFGSGSPDWFAPWNNRHLVVLPPGGRLEPFIDHGVPEEAIRLRDVSVERVETRLRSALNAG